MAEKKKELSPNVQGVVDRCNKVESYWNPALANLHENWRYYWGLYPQMGQGQWPMGSIPKMLQSGRQLTQYNFILPIIDSLVAMIMDTPFEPQFLALDDNAKQMSDLAQHMMYADRNLMDWEVTKRKIALAGLIFEGVMKMVVSDRYDPLGNIGFDTCAQGSVLFDPFWKSGNRKELKRVWKKSWMSAEDIYRIYKTERAQIRSELEKMHGEEYGAYLGINPFDTSSTKMGSMEMVFEEYFMKPVEKVQEIIIGPDGAREMPDIPDEDKPEYMDKFLPGWDKTSVIEETYTIEECLLRTACPGISGDQLLVDSEKTEVQIGSPPFFKWASAFENGQSRGMVDSLKDAQTNENFIEAEILRKIQSEGGGGSKFVDNSLFLNPKEASRFEKYSSRPDMKFIVKPGTLRKGLTPSHPVETTGVPAALYQNITHIQRDIVPTISKRPPVSMGQTDQGNQTSGVLFRLMGGEANSQTKTMVTSFREFWQDAHEAYLIQAGQTYANEMLPREFVHNKKIMVANLPVEHGKDIIVANDARMLLKMRSKILISERQASPSDKANTANSLSKFMQYVPAESLGTRAVIAHEVIKNIESLDDEAQNQMKEMSKLETDLAKARLQLAIETTNAQLGQIKAQQEAAKAATLGPPAPPAPQQPSYELPNNENIPQTEGETINQGVQNATSP